MRGDEPEQTPRQAQGLERTPNDGIAKPIRLDFWSGESLTSFGEELAGPGAPTLPVFVPFMLSERMRSNRRAMRQNHRQIEEASRSGGVITPAAEWILDNQHIVEETFRHLVRDLTPEGYRNLPQTRLPDGTEIPRALALIWSYIAATNSAVTVPTLTEITTGFQRHEVLTIGEIWAIPALLRFVLLENLRRLSDRVGRARRLRNDANAIADRLPGLGDREAAELLARERHAGSDQSFWSQMLYRLRDGSNSSPGALRWLETSLKAEDTTPEQIIATEHARQSSGNVTVGNIVRSLRKIDEIDWFAWFEDVSRVDAILRRDPDYLRLDKTTRNTYRETIERIARQSDATETAVAEAAADSAGPGAGVRLLGEERGAFMRAMGYRRHWREVAVAGYRRLGWVGVFLPAVILTLAAAVLMAHAMPARRLSWLETTLFVAALLPASEAMLGLLSRIAARLVPPHLLPAYDYTAGVPEEARTLVVIPCLLTGHDEIDTLVRSLEVHYLANPRGAVSFALLSDWTDARTEDRADDADLLDHARQGIDRLAARYDADGGRRFFLLHRARLFDAADGVWMGWERKRGKLVELNQLLRGDADTSFLDTGPRPPEGVRYVLTLDADTRLVRDAVPALVGKMAHPVNRPLTAAGVAEDRRGGRGDASGRDADGRVVRGYGIMQPRLSPSLSSGADASIFQRVFSVDRGLDPYVFTASDLYQDLLGSGSFTGKGIYDVDAFARATETRIPEGAVLSHDLLEGSLARAALVSDVRFVEDFPVDYLVEASRQHRWVRGDWQLLPFILNPGNGLSGLARLKMTDNLRRSLVAPGWVLASVLGWLTLPFAMALNWQGLLLLTLVLTSLMSIRTGLQPSQTMPLQLWYAGRFVHDILGHLYAMLLRLAFMAHAAAISADAILRTLYRLFLSRRNLLEWRTARQVADGPERGPRAYLRAMVASPVIGVAGLVLTAAINPQNFGLALAGTALWCAAPVVAWWTSRTLETADSLDLAPSDEADLRRIARLTWRFFEDFVTHDSSDLPPDNYQDLPAPKIAERTSPSNIGLYLLSVVSARDFGWISMDSAVARIDRTLATVGRMETFRGHLYNWYDTRTLAVLQPRYVSSVDSGNLAGHLIAVARALKGWAAAPMVHLLTDPRGVLDTLGVVRRTVAAIPDDRRALRPLRRRLEERIEGFATTHATYLTEPQLAPVRAIGLAVVADDIRTLARAYGSEIGPEASRELIRWVDALKLNCEELLKGPVTRAGEAEALALRIDALAERARAIAFSMDFGFLLDTESGLLSIGYRPDPGHLPGQLDDSRYDLLASEARLASLFAIAKGDVPNKHWFRLGRPVAAFGLDAGLLSWSGSMFEYLMPPLVMHERPGSILHQSCRAAISRQIRLGRTQGLPWGISESAFNARDADLNYQYFAFGAPALGLKRMAPGDRVVAPYASALAAQLAPAAAVANLARLEAMGALGVHGFFDAVDFTPRRLPEGEDHAVVRTVMAHHQGMTIAAIANAVLKGIHRDRFHDDPVIQAAELLLQEREPSDIMPITRAGPAKDRSGAEADINPVAQTIVTNPGEADHAVGILSNGRLSAMLSATGSGYIRVGDRAVTRWRPDLARSDSGTFFFLRDLGTGDWWSATTAPRPAPGEVATAIFSDHKAEFTKRARGIGSHLEVVVGSEANAIGHRLTLTNMGDAERMIEVTSYGEIVLDTDAADAAHPAFSKMFVRTDVVRGGTTITASRNARMASDRPLHLAHLICGTPGATVVEAGTDRRAFVGRGRDLGTAAAFDAGAALDGTSGFTLDPIFALRRKIRVAPGKEVSVTFWTVVTDTAEDLDRAVAHYCRAEVFEHESRLAWTLSQVQLRHLDTSLEAAALFRQIAAFLVYPDTRLGPQNPEVRAALGPQSGLWPMGISGDNPIMVLRTDNEADLPIVGKVLRLQEFLRARGVLADLVILNERKSSYVQDLQTAIDGMWTAAAQASYGDAKKSHVFPLRRDRMAEEDWRALLAAARIVLHTRNGKLSEQVRRFRATQPAAPAGSGQRLLPPPKRTVPQRPPLAFPDEALTHLNGYGGFAEGGRAYVVRLRHGGRTPQPWINVIGRPDFGFHVSAEGSGYVWAANSRDYQITPWSNDPVIDRPGEGIWIRDQKTGRLATPFASLSDDPGAIFEARHGLGSTEFRAWTDWVEVVAVQTLALSGPAKVTHLTVRNITDRTLVLDCASYAELVLGNDPSKTAAMVRVGYDADLRAVTARNPYSMDWADRVTALGADRPVTGHMTSRSAFVGRDHRIGRPAAMTGPWPETEADPRPGDPCAAILTRMDLEPGTSGTITFALANAPEGEVQGVLAGALRAGSVKSAVASTRAEWDDFLGALQVETPDDRIDLLLNTWLPYQALACRIRSRSAFYQASGAFGFRDQLQDTAALLLHDPSLARHQILEAAGRQFPEGDVQHWWLPATGAGVRTTISDDVVWLAHVTALYVGTTGETGLLDEAVPFLHGKVLDEGEHDAFFQPDRGGETAPLYDHCALALDLAIARTGPHGLPLMLGGDWNDGMNRVGEGGRGESVWLGWFLATTLDAFVPLAEARGDPRASAWRAHRTALGAALETSGWDGEWFRRGYYDDGTPLGSALSAECRIDSIAQSWAVISGVAAPARAAQAMDSALAHLADREAGILKLFTPPFEKTDREPGYIKGYPPGVRENGGQYTHAAAWLIYALGRMGRGGEAVAMLDMISPITHSATRKDADRYRVEPYVIAADIYGGGTKAGRGGWTWYTGSAGWMARAITEGILGITLERGTHLRVDPAIPDAWPGFTVRLRHGGQVRLIEAKRTDGRLVVTVDGRRPSEEGTFALDPGPADP